MCCGTAMVMMASLRGLALIPRVHGDDTLDLGNDSNPDTVIYRTRDRSDRVNNFRKGTLGDRV